MTLQLKEIIDLSAIASVHLIEINDTMALFLSRDRTSFEPYSPNFIRSEPMIKFLLPLLDNYFDKNNALFMVMGMVPIKPDSREAVRYLVQNIDKLYLRFEVLPSVLCHLIPALLGGIECFVKGFLENL